MSDTRSLELWHRYGDHLLMVQPFMDSVLAHGEGCYLVDVDGNRILDMAAGQFCSVLGYRHAGFAEALKRQLDDVVHIGDQYVSEVVLRCAARLASITPGDLNKVLLLSTGSEANECAMRIAKSLTNRVGMVGYNRGYYGISIATRSLSSVSDYSGKTDFLPVPPSVHRLLAPTCVHCPIGLTYPSCQTRCLDTSLEILGANADSIAGVIVEPIISAGGMIVPPIEYVQRLYDATQRAGALFIVDEAQTGFGRSGKWFDIENYGIVPDILVFSKTSGNGYPVAGLVIREELAARLEQMSFTHLSSHQNDPLSAAAVVAVIEAIESENLLARSAQMGTYLVEQLRKLGERHHIIKDVRGRGLMVGMELDTDAGVSAAFNCALLCEERMLHLTYTYYEPVIRFIPPLTISEQDIDYAIGVLDEVLPLVVKLGRRMVEGPKNRRSGPFVRQLNGALSPQRILRKIWTTSPHDIAEALRRRLT